MHIHRVIDKACEHLRNGKPIIICDSDDREGEGDLAFSARLATPILVNQALTLARGLICVSLPAEYAERFGIVRLPSNNKDIHDTPFGSPVSLADGTSGISVPDRCATINALGDLTSEASTFCSPGHISTLIAKKGGVLVRDGHTEAVVDILAVSGVGGAGVICEILNSAGSIASRTELEQISRNFDIPLITIEQIKDEVRRHSISEKDYVASL